MANEEVGASFEEFSQGGLIDDADVTIKLARFTTWDYNGKTAPVLALQVNMEDAEGQIHEQYLSSGDLKNFRPSADGTKAVPNGDQTKLNMNTNAVAFLISLMNADTRGELAAKLRPSGDVSLLEGLRCHIIREAQPKRPGIVAPGVEEGQPQFAKTCLKVASIIAYPWEKGGAVKPAAAGKAAPAVNAAAPAAAAMGAGEEVENMAVGMLIGILAANGGSIKKSMIAGKVFSDPDLKKESAPVRNGVLGIVVNEAFLGAEGRPWTFDKATSTVSMG